MSDIINQKFNSWTVLSESSIKRKNRHLTCQCSCGTIKDVAFGNLIKGLSKKCKACSGTEKKDLSGQTFENWTVIKPTSKRKFLCRCKCGIEKEVLNYHLLSGASTKCRKCNNTEAYNNEIIPNQNVINSYIENGQTIIEIQCFGCGKAIKTIPAVAKKRKTNLCYSCIQFKGYEDISLGYYSSLAREAKYRNIDFQLSIKDIWELYIKQNKRCSLSGLDISFTKDRKNQTASIDRIDNNKGYRIDNIQIVHKKINFMKHINSQSDFILYCNLVAKTNPIENL